ncbi:MAG: uroporphyrinogen decarboxylase [Candidatus Omnitrophica bacterium]|nr:uroporphyrinogen decarboxylase [Candidatus Omnitrophota bacterium]
MDRFTEINTPSRDPAEGFENRLVLSFESRESRRMERLIELAGGRPLCVPSLQFIPLEGHPEAHGLGQKLLRNEIHILILMTGYGVRCLGEILLREFDRNEILSALRRVTTVARGPKSVFALRELGVEPTLAVEEPGTWQEILSALEDAPQGISASQKTVAILEEVGGHEGLAEALKKRGARILEVPVYRWALPADHEPIKQALQALLREEAAAVLFTNASQINSVLRVAAELGWEKDVRAAMSRTLVASVGPHCSERLREFGIQIDFEPRTAKMENLVQETAENLKRLREDRQKPLVVLERRSQQTPSERELREEGPFMKACRGRAAQSVPVWLMRQAGRYQKEYRAIRSRVGFLELCKNKDLCAEVTVFAQEQTGADAAILFSDILLIVEPMGLGLEFGRGEGPMISGASASAILKRPDIEPRESLGFVMEAVRLIRSCLKPQIPLIGFSGAPFTLASYILEGGASRNYIRTKSLMASDPDTWHALMEKIARAAAKYLNAQIDAGADVVQVFDSWVGCLPPEDYRRFVLPHTRALIQSLKPGVPVIHFSTGTGAYLPLIREAGGDVIGIDFRISVQDAWRAIGHDRGLQGNLDPVLLCGPREVMLREAKRVLDEAAGRPGFIFNVGQGLLPETSVSNVQALVDYVHAYRG